MNKLERAEQIAAELEENRRYIHNANLVAEGANDMAKQANYRRKTILVPVK